MEQKKQTDYEIFFPKVAKGYLSSVFNLSNKNLSQVEISEKYGFTAFGCQTEKELIRPESQSLCFDIFNDQNNFANSVKHIIQSSIQNFEGQCKNKENSLLLKSNNNVNSTEQMPIDIESQCKQKTSIASLEKLTKKKTKIKKKKNNTGGCNCKKSKCLKLYCECFQNQKVCGEQCECAGCYNIEKYEELREVIKKETLEKNPYAFKSKYKKIQDQDKKLHSRGCNCTKTGCKKNYCECFREGIGCSRLCRCENCKNQYISLKDDEVGKYYERVLRKRKKNNHLYDFYLKKFCNQFQMEWDFLIFPSNVIKNDNSFDDDRILWIPVEENSQEINNKKYQISKNFYPKSLKQQKNKNSQIKLNFDRKNSFIQQSKISENIFNDNRNLSPCLKKRNFKVPVLQKSLTQPYESILQNKHQKSQDSNINQFIKFCEDSEICSSEIEKDLDQMDPRKKKKKTSIGRESCSENMIEIQNSKSREIQFKQVLSSSQRPQNSLQLSFFPSKDNKVKNNNFQTKKFQENFQAQIYCNQNFKSLKKHLKDLKLKTNQSFIDCQFQNSKLPFTYKNQVTHSVPCVYIKNESQNRLLIYLHANAEDIFNSIPFLEILSEHLQISILCPEYPSYSIYKDKKPTEQAINKDCIAVIKYAIKHLKHQEHQISILGRSLGCSFALEINRHFQFHSCILISPFYSIRTLVQDKFGRFASYMIKEKFSNFKKIHNSEVPLLLIHGDDDEIVPYKHSLNLFECCKSNFAMLYIIKKMKHNICFLRKELLDPIEEFWDSLKITNNYNY